MTRYKIMDANSSVISGGMPYSVTAEIKICDDKGDNIFLSLSETDGPNLLFKTDRSTFAEQVDPASFTEEFVTYMDSHSLDEDVYFEMLKDDASEFHTAIKYLTFLVRGEKAKIEPFIQRTVGKHLDEIEIPTTEWERELFKEYDEELDLPEGIKLTFPKDKELLFRLCLAYSAEHEVESIFKDMSPEDVAVNEYILEEVQKLIDFNEYEVWKKPYLDSEYAKLKGRSFLAVSYMFAGIGGYDDVIPEEQFESFICWINGNGSAFFTGKREATKAEVMEYIARHAYDGYPSVVEY